jgi:cobalt-zinc-cadmium efflux system protein
MQSRVLLWVLLNTLGFAVLEALGGWWAGSLALLGDAGHMLSDSTALGLAAFAAFIAQRPPSRRHSYGLGRAEVVAALVNALFMLAVVTGIVIGAVDRLLEPAPVAGGLVMLIAGAGLIINIVVALLLARGEQSLNTRAALLHVMGDLLGSIAALIAGAVVYFTGWTPIDPILSLLICALLLYTSLRLLREALHVLMEGVPGHLDLQQVGRTMASQAGVVSVHDLHIWTLSSGREALSAHVVIADLHQWQRTLSDIQRVLGQEFHIDHITLQPELQGSGLPSFVTFPARHRGS